MKKIIGLVKLIMNVVLLPLYLIRYIILSIILLYGCIRFKGDIKTEFKDFNEITMNKIKTRLKIHRKNIIGDWEKLGLLFSFSTHRLQ